MSPVLEVTPALEEGISLLDAESGTSPPSSAPTMDPDLSSETPLVNLSEDEGVLNSEHKSSSSSESEEEEASDENATALLKQLTKIMLVNQKQQRKERKESQKLLKTLVKDNTTLTQHLDIGEGNRQRLLKQLLKQSVEVPKWREGNTILFFSSLEEIYSSNKILSHLWGSYMQHHVLLKCI